MKRFIQGEHRRQCTMLPETLDDYITEHNPVRVVDVFVENLDLYELGFVGIKLIFYTAPYKLLPIQSDKALNSGRGTTPKARRQ